MLEHVPTWIGALLRTVRAGHAKLAIVQEDLAVPETAIDFTSPAFAYDARLPVRFTADGDGVSPPLVWGEVPPATQSLALIVEDPDAPALQPLVHALVWNIAPDSHGLAEGAILPDASGSADGSDVGRNSFLQEGWLPPDPPRGHGSHDYVFQLFALDQVIPLDPNPGRSEMVKTMAGHVLAAGLLVGTYSRDEEAPISDWDTTTRPVAV